MTDLDLLAEGDHRKAIFEWILNPPSAIMTGIKNRFMQAARAALRGSGV